jgi:hypothetical protein
LNNAELTNTGYTIDRCETLEERSEADQIVWECKVTDYLQEQVDFFNPTLKSFQLRLEMEDNTNNGNSNDLLSILVKREELST